MHVIPIYLFISMCVLPLTTFDVKVSVEFVGFCLFKIRLKIPFQKWTHGASQNDLLGGVNCAQGRRNKPLRIGDCFQRKVATSHRTMHNILAYDTHIMHEVCRKVKRNFPSPVANIAGGASPYIVNCDLPAQTSHKSHTTCFWFTYHLHEYYAVIK